MATQGQNSNIKKFISHRGNLQGRKPQLENSPEYILEAINAGFDVEIDVRYIDGKFKLGHDSPKYDFPFNLIDRYSKKLWLHCKNLQAVVALSNFPLNTQLNYFWHQKDDVTLTSKGYIWAFPGKQPLLGSIAVLPEIYNDNISESDGICSDYILDYKNNIR